MSDRSPHERQAQGNIDGSAEIERLDRDETLVMIHGDARIAARRMKKGISSNWTFYTHTRRVCSVDSLGYGPFFIAHDALLSGMRVKPANPKVRRGDTEINLQATVGQGDAREDPFRRNEGGYIL
jgi:hypothetical protein